PRVQLILKTAVTAGSTTSLGALTEYGALQGAFIESLGSVGAFDRMYADMRQIPEHTRVSIVTSGAAAGTIGEMMLTPISFLAIGGKSLPVYKNVTVLVSTEELIRLTASTSLLGNEMRKGIALQTDTQALTILTSGISPASS